MLVYLINAIYKALMQGVAGKSHCYTIRIIRKNKRTEQYMKEISFIHLSDIHFSKFSGNPADIDEDIRNAILTDLRINAQPALSNVKGILLGGDIAYMGLKKEYENACSFLRNISQILKIDEKSVYCVPGNHDVNQQRIKESRSIYSAQSEIESAKTLDSADKILEAYTLDEANPNLLYTALEQYNNFAARYNCNINSQKPIWIEEFGLEHGMSLKICGMNSCLISSHEDHKVPGIVRKMFINQTQIPPYEEGVAWVSLCHHPIDLWLFGEELQGKFDKRADIQLFGHKHEEVLDDKDERLRITAGAAHPVRGKDWNPRYNWISFKCIKNNKDRCLEVKIYPRVLSKDRDRFIADLENCPKDIFCKYTINIDGKRRKNLQDVKCVEKEGAMNVDRNTRIMQNTEKEIVYYFFDLSYIRQTEILYKLNLFKDEYAGKEYIDIIEDILDNARVHNCMEQFEKLVKTVKS